MLLMGGGGVRNAPDLLAALGYVPLMTEFPEARGRRGVPIANVKAAAEA